MEKPRRKWIELGAILRFRKNFCLIKINCTFIRKKEEEDVKRACKYYGSFFLVIFMFLN